MHPGSAPFHRGTRQTLSSFPCHSLVSLPLATRDYKPAYMHVTEETSTHQDVRREYGLVWTSIGGADPPRPFQAT